MNYTDIINELELDTAAQEKLRALMDRADARHKALQREGIKKAHEKGVKFGRPRVQISCLDQVIRLYQEHQLSLADAAKLCDVSRSTIYRRYLEIKRAN